MVEDLHGPIAYGLGGILALGGAWLLFDKDALRDDSILQRKKPYSLARVQLWFWTLLILGSEFTLLGSRGSFWPFNTTCLALLGLSGSTLALGKIIDERDARSTARHQDATPSEGFLRDILSDERGLSVHRFQSCLFHLAYGAGFLLDTFKPETLQFPSFDGTTLALLGVSSGAYLTLKANENRESGPATSVEPRVPAAASRPAGLPAMTPSDELLDPEIPAP